ncbi:GntR family transcriptional regulator [Leucobacter luti]|uniref:GntR family transcriptional regulator n=1 Tax=Leucobacter luti TaxID=340320 RepID=UPI003CFDF71A
MSDEIAGTRISLDFELDRSSAVPPFEQLRDAVIAAVNRGSLPPGSRLPTVRGLAASFGLATNTVAHAYRALDEAGITEARGRAGTFVALDADDRPAARAAAAAFAEAMRRLGIGPDEALALASDAVRGGA